MSSSTQAQSPDLTDTFGALYIGVIFAAMLVNSFLPIRSKLSVCVVLTYLTEQSLRRNQRSSLHLLSDA